MEQNKINQVRVDVDVCEVKYRPILEDNLVEADYFRWKTGSYILTISYML